MAPRRQRPKVGLTRMHAALDAMRPMGFSSDVVRKCVKKLLKVYGNEGWIFIEESAYKLLIDTILEEPDVSQIESTSENLLLEDDPHENPQQQEHVHQLCDKEVTPHDQLPTVDTYQVMPNGKDIIIQEEVKQDQGSIDMPSLTPLQVGAQLFLPSPYFTPQSSDGISTKERHKPCYGWISDNDENEDKDIDDFVMLEPSRQLNFS